MGHIEQDSPTPNGKRENIVVTSGYHDSQWQHHLSFSGLSPDKYSEEQKELISNLIVSNEWIEEESNNIKDIIYKEMQIL